VGSRCDLYSLAARVCLSSSLNGCVYTRHSRLASGTHLGAGVDLTEYVDYHDAYQQLGRFLDEVCMLKRIHSSLGYLTPAEFESQWRAQQVAEVTHLHR
jgi:transposase InsO family protein